MTIKKWQQNEVFFQLAILLVFLATLILSPTHSVQ